MNPQQMFCPHESCPLRGQLGKGNIVCHSKKERRFRCSACAHTFAQTQGTPFYRLHTEEQLVIWVLILLTHGCSVQGIVAAFGLDERTVADWQSRAGEHCRKVHEQTVCSGKVDLLHVQADELWVKMVGKKVWMALAIAAPSRLWLAGQLGVTRNAALIDSVAAQVRRCAKELGILVCVDGLARYVTAFRHAFSVRVYSGKGGRPPRRLTQEFLLGQVIKRVVRRRLAEVEHRAVCGSMQDIEARLAATKTGQTIHTAYIERLNATFRGRLAALVRRGRALVRQEPTLVAGMYLVGTSYNFCDYHASLRLPAAPGTKGKWVERTPAMAAGLTDHRWSMADLLHLHPAPPPPCPVKRRRGRPRKPRPIPWKLRPRRFVLASSTV